MGMAAISGSTRDIADAAVQAVQAGEDILLTTSPSTAKAAYAGILDAFHAGTIPVRRIDESVIRILTLKADWKINKHPLPSAPVPDRNANTALSFRVGIDAITLLKDTAGLVPLPPEARHVLIIGPTDGWGLYPVLENALTQQGHTVNRYTYSTPWEGPVPESAYLDTLPALAHEFDLVLVLTWEAHLNRLRYNDPWQMEMVNRLLAEEIPLVVVALKSPTDLLEFPQVSTYMATHGTTAGQIQGLANALTGGREPVGISPLPGLHDLPTQ
jgi:beta-N-acetylhexosaminidase